MNTHYQPTRADDGTWKFTTPMGDVEGMFSETEAKRTAGRTEAADRTCAANNKGPLAKVLRPHFFPEEVAP